MTGDADRSNGPIAERHRKPPPLAVAFEELVANRLGARIYSRWVGGLVLAGDERVLELGTGAGACARHLADALPNGRLTCVEIDDRWLSVARQRLASQRERVEFVHANAAEWSRSHAFDVVVAHFMLHDLSATECAGALRNLAQSLDARGRLCVRDPLGHGLGLAELHVQLKRAGFELAEEERREWVPLMGQTVSGVWKLR